MTKQLAKRKTGRARRFSKEHHAKISAALLGRKHSEGHKAKIRETMRRKWRLIQQIEERADDHQ